MRVIIIKVCVLAVVNCLLICKEEKLVAVSGADIVDGSFPFDYKRLHGRSCKRLVERATDCANLFNSLVIKWEKMPDFTRVVTERYLSGYHCEGLQLIGNDTMLASTACAESKELAHGLACCASFVGIVYGGVPSLRINLFWDQLF